MPGTISKYYVNQRPNSSQPWALAVDNLTQPNWIDTDPTARANGADYQAFGVTATNQVIASKIVSASVVAAGGFVWALTGTSPLFAVAQSIAVDSNGASAFGGAVVNSVNWGNGVMNANARDSIYGKIGASGSLIQAAVIGSTHDFEVCKGVRFDSSRNMWALGDFGYTVNFSLGGTNMAGPTLTSNGSNAQVNIYLAKYNAANPAGLLVLKQFGTASGAVSSALAIDAFDNVIMAVNVQAATSFGAYSIPSGSGIVKLDPSGTPLWATGVGTLSDRSINFIDTDSDGSVVISGTKFGGSNNGFITRYTSAGVLVWDRVFTSSSGVSATAWGVAIDRTTHNVIAVGLYGQNTDFGGTITDFFGTANNSAVNSGGSFIAAYSAANVFQWARTPNVSGYPQSDESCYAVVIDQFNGNIYFAGKCNSAIYLGNPNNQIMLGGHGNYLGAIRRDASALWGYRSTGATGAILALAIAPSGQLRAGGSVSNSRMYFNAADQTNGGSVTTTSGTTSAFVASFNR